MTPERWRRVTSLFHAVRSQPIDAREAYLNEACRDDPSLVADVVAMLQADRATSVGAPASVAAAPVLVDGVSIGPYRVEGQIGRSGRASKGKPLGIARQIASALEAAREKGIVHRDLKPANVKIDDLGDATS
jgi:serine/threonine protein kinase